MENTPNSETKTDLEPLKDNTTKDTANVLNDDGKEDRPVVDTVFFIVHQLEKVDKLQALH